MAESIKFARISLFKTVRDFRGRVKSAWYLDCA